MNERRRTLFLASAMAGCLLSSTAMAQDWPSEPLHVFVGFPAGSSPDTIARLVAEPLAEALGQPVIVENRPGAGGVIAIQQMIARENDNYNLA